MLPMSEFWNLKSSYGAIIRPKKAQMMDVKPPTRPRIRSKELIDQVSWVYFLA